MQAVDARLKLVYLLFALVLGLMSARATFLAVSALLFLFQVLLARPGARAFKRLLIPLGFASFFFAAHLFFGEGPYAVFYFAGQGVRYSPGGLAAGLLIALRIASGVLAFFWFAQDTALHEVNTALAWLRVPAPIVSILGMTWRYLAVYEEEVARMQRARTVRLGFAGWRPAVASLTAIGGQAVVRAFDHSERVYRAMQGRGFDGRAAVPGPEPLQAEDWRRGARLLLPSLILFAAYLLL